MRSLSTNLPAADEPGPTMKLDVFRRARSWATTVLLWLAMGFVIGIGLDGLLWRISFNYLYSPYEFTRKFSWWSMAVATIVGAAAATGNKPPARLLGLAQASALCVALTVTVSIGWALLAAGFAWSAGEMPASDDYLAPVRRVRFCNGLCQGAALAYWAGSLLAAARMRFSSTRLSNSGIGKPASRS